MSILGQRNFVEFFGLQGLSLACYYLAISVLAGLLMVLVAYKFLQALQLEGYKSKEYWNWFKRTKAFDFKVVVMLSFLCVCTMFMTNVLLSGIAGNILSLCGFGFFILFSLLYFLNAVKGVKKTPLKYTARIIRICIVVALLSFVESFMLTVLSVNFIPYLDYAIIGFMPLSLPVVVWLSYIILLPFEILNGKRYIRKAKKRLEAVKGLKVVGITGSYGKTSVKNILSEMLSEKFKVCATPQSYNTPFGLSKTILSSLNVDDEVFVAEMGAKRVGDIKFLCDMVKPCVGVITGIGNQHMFTFGSMENLKSTKFELVDFVTANNGVAYFNDDCELNKELFERATCKKVKTSIDDNSSRVWIEDIAVDENGSKFVLCDKSKRVECQTSLLGKHNISNILLCAGVAYDMGLSVEEISNSISRLVAPKHRLEIVKSDNSLIVIDDAYNGSVEGARAGLDTLSLFKSKKFVVTPGLVELGDDEYKCNFELGKEMASVCDGVIINGKHNEQAIKEGLKSAGYDEEKIVVVSSVEQAVAELSGLAGKGDVVLFENDLPDNYR